MAVLAADRNPLLQPNLAAALLVLLPAVSEAATEDEAVSGAALETVGVGSEAEAGLAAVEVGMETVGTATVGATVGTAAIAGLVV